MAKLYFFTDINRIDHTDFSQSQVVNPQDFPFGPVSSNSTNEFNVTSMHKYTGTEIGGPRAYAICNGQIIAREELIDDPQNPGTKIPKSPSEYTLIQKADLQIAKGLPKIKFIIYRGVLKSSLVNENNNQLFILDDSDPNSNDLTAKIQASHAGRGHNAPAPGEPLFAVSNPVTRPITGLETESEAKLNRAFLRLDQTPNDLTDPAPSQCQGVDAGDYIGLFNPQSFGIEIIQDTIGFEPDLSFAELSQKVINIADGDSKEDILPFIDPCGFYGSLNGQKIHLNELDAAGVTTNLLGKYKEQEAYDEIIKKVFNNRNKVYVEIKNEFNYSYDYFNEYTGMVGSNPTGNLRFSADPSLIMTNNDLIDYNNYSGVSWPLMIVDGLAFQNSLNNQHSEIQLSFPSGGVNNAEENMNPILYLVQGELLKSRKRKKVQPILTPKMIGYPHKFTKPIRLKLNNDVTNNEGPISTYVRIKYAKQAPQNQTVPYEDDLLRSVEILDNVFRPFDMELPLQTGVSSDGPDFISRIYEDEIKLDTTMYTGDISFCKQGISEDIVGGVTIFTVLSKRLRKLNITQVVPFAQNGSSGQYFTETITQKDHLTSPHFCLESQNIEDPIGDFNNVARNIELNELNDEDGFAIYDPRDLNFLTFSKTQWVSLTQVFVATNFDNNGKGVHLGLVFDKALITLLDHTESFTKTAAYDVVLRGKVAGDYLEVPAGIKLYLSAKSPEVQPEIDQTGAGFTLTNDGITNNFPEPPYVTSGSQEYSQLFEGSGTDIPTYTINSKIYLVKGWNIGNAEFHQYKDYFETNIKQVWDSDKNAGLGCVYGSVNAVDGATGAGTMANNPNGNFERSHVLCADGIEVKVASLEQLNNLKQEECIFLVESGMGKYRSYVDTSTNRTGTMYRAIKQPDDTPNTINAPYIESENIPAHEFGHILGLADYYSYAGEAKYHLNEVNGEDKAARNLSSINRKDNGDVYDKELGLRFNWIHNLMSTLKNVSDEVDWTTMPSLPDFSDVPLGSKKVFEHIFRTETYKVYHKWFMPTLPNGDSNPKICVFITPTQINAIVDFADNLPAQQPEKQFLYLRKSNYTEGTTIIGNGDYMGTFVSRTFFKEGEFNLDIGESIEVIATDDEFYNAAIFDHSTYDSVYNVFSHNMNYRCMKNCVAVYDQTQNQTPTFSFSYQICLSPFVENDLVPASSSFPNYIKEHQLLMTGRLNTMRMLQSKKNVILDYDVEVGGIATNESRKIRACQNSIVRKSDGSETILVPGAPPRLPVPAPDDLEKGWLKKGHPKHMGLNARKIFSTTLVYIAKHLDDMIADSYKFPDGSAAGSGVNSAKFTEYEDQFKDFLTGKHNDWNNNKGVKKHFYETGGIGEASVEDKYKNVAQNIFIQGSGSPVNSDGSFWNKVGKTDDLVVGDSYNDFYANPRIVRDGNASMKFHKYTLEVGEVPKKKGSNPLATYRQKYKYYNNRRIIMNLLVYGNTTSK